MNPGNDKEGQRLMRERDETRWRVEYEAEFAEEEQHTDSRGVRGPRGNAPRVRVRPAADYAVYRAIALFAL